jgi:electron transport complex protein RnfD
MASVAMALVPSGAVAIWVHGPRCAAVIGSGIVGALLSEWMVCRFLKKPSSLADNSALVTGILLAFSLPPAVPPWMPFLGSSFAILAGKLVFGGLGTNPVNPALLGRLFLIAGWPATLWTCGATGPQDGAQWFDAASGATPLCVFRQARSVLFGESGLSADRAADAALAVSRLYETVQDRFLIHRGGCIGETSGLLLLAGAGFLLYRRVIGWKIPLSFLAAAACFAWIAGGTEGTGSGNPAFHLMSGGMLVAAFFMATDPVTSPVSTWSRVAFGAGCGTLCIALRLWGFSPEGVGLAVLLMNLVNTVGRRHAMAGRRPGWPSNQRFKKEGCHSGQ